MIKHMMTPAYPDRMPIDISFVFADEKPAGKHGFLKPDGDHFRFEDGTLARFWGVNFNGGANFPEHDYAEKVARRLAQVGCNLVRFHQLDAEWDIPNIYTYTRGRRVTTTRVLDPVSMDHMDYLIHCLKEEGIYVYFDMMTYRKFKSGDGVPYAEQLRDSAKPYSIFDPKLIELQKEFADQIWNRYNPYTGMYYRDDPVFVMTEITNECDIFVPIPANKGPECPYYTEEFRGLFEAWLREKGIDYGWETYDMYSRTDEVLLRFKIELSKKYYREMYDYLRSLGVKVAITGTNWFNQMPCNIISESDMDFVDGHYYCYDWRWGEEDKFCANTQINGGRSTLHSAGVLSTSNRPFFVSEWDMPWPNIYRAEGPIYCAAVSALQDWTGMAIHTYAYGTQLCVSTPLGKEVSSSSIGGVPYREGIFSVWNDPAKFGLFYHAALIVRRCDVAPAEKKIGVTQPKLGTVVRDAFCGGGMEMHRMRTQLDGEQPEGCDAVITGYDTVKPEDDTMLISDHGQLKRNIPKHIAFIDTPRTKAVYGDLRQAAGEAALCDGLRVSSEDDFGVLALSSLSDLPTEKSDNMLLSAISRAWNTDAVFDGDRMVNGGHTPVFSDVIHAEISLRTDRTDLSVWGINAEGFYVGRLPVTYRDGRMTFRIGETMPALYYLIVAE